MNNPTISAAIFRVACGKLRHRDGASMHGAELVLVEGISQGEAAKRVGVSVQTISRAAKRVREAILDEGMCPLCGRRP